MIAIVTLISSMIKSNRRVPKVRVLGMDDVREPLEIAPAGIDSAGTKGMRALYLDTVDRANPVIIGYLNEHQLALEGEWRAYATDADGNVVFNMWQRRDGKLLVGTSVEPADYTNFLVKFNELKSGFDQLKEDFNNHTHMYNPGGGALTATGGVTPSAASIDGSKATNIETN